MMSAITPSSSARSPEMLGFAPDLEKFAVPIDRNVAGDGYLSRQCSLRSELSTHGARSSSKTDGSRTRRQRHPKCRVQSSTGSTRTLTTEENDAPSRRSSYGASRVAWPGEVALPAGRCADRWVLVSRFRMIKSLSREGVAVGGPSERGSGAATEGWPRRPGGQAGEGA